MINTMYIVNVHYAQHLNIKTTWVQIWEKEINIYTMTDYNSNLVSYKIKYQRKQYFSRIDFLEYTRMYRRASNINGEYHTTIRKLYNNNGGQSI